MAKIYKIALILLFFSTLPVAAEAATLSFSPASGEYAVGKTLSVSVYVGSVDQAMNAASGIISFPPDKLEITSLSKSDSIFTLWVQEPSFSNSAGTVNFEGIVLNPGFMGAKGKVITINFRAKATGVAPLNFSSGSALANDGKGTNILTNLGKAEFSLGGAAPTVPKATTPATINGVPQAPQISSPTHPDPDKWYSKKDAKFTWTTPPGVTGVRLLVGKIPAAIPTVTYTPAISEKEVTNFSDGTWYFHARFRNSAGWGATAHFRFQIDTEPPESFSIKFIDGKETTNPQPTIVFDTTDSLSGVNYYKVKIAGGDFFSLAPEIVKSNPYTLPLQNPGKRNILIQAFDKAENYAVATEEFTITPPKAEPVVFYIGTWAVSFLAVVTLLLALIVVLLFILWYGWHKLLTLRKQLPKQVSKAESALHKTFDLLKDDIREQVKMLEKTRSRRQLTKEEDMILKQLKSHLDDAEKFIRNEIENIEKELK